MLVNIFSEDVLSDVDLRPRDEEVIDKVREREEMVDDDVKELLSTFKLYSLMRLTQRLPRTHRVSRTWLRIRGGLVMRSLVLPGFSVLGWP